MGVKAAGGVRDLEGLKAMVAALLAATLASACGDGDKPTTPSTPRLGRVFAALLAAADNTTAPWRCAALDVPPLRDEELATDGRTWKLSGHTVTRTDDDNDVVIGVVADAAGAAPRTIAALGRIRAALDAAKPDVVLTLGGMGASTDELVASLGTLSDHAAWPLVALPGDLEPMGAHLAAIATLRTRGDVVIDGRSARWIKLGGGATVATVPGAGASERLGAGAEGCAWTAADISKLMTELSAKSGARILASAEAPRQTIDGEAAGELALVTSKALPIDVVLHGPLTPQPTPAKSGGRDGTGVALSPGTADATSRLPEAHRPSAGVLVVRGGGAWSWRPLVDATKK
jgi:hypothetical protein